jgi:hypothetical protein
MYTKYRTRCDHELVHVDNLVMGLMTGWLAEQADKLTDTFVTAFHTVEMFHLSVAVQSFCWTLTAFSVS